MLEFLTGILCTLVEALILDITEFVACLGTLMRALGILSAYVLDEKPPLSAQSSSEVRKVTLCT